MPLTRRTFTAGLLGAAAASARSSSRIVGANERLRIGVIGCGGMATGHMRGLLRTRQEDNTEIAAVSDVYAPRLDAAALLTGARPFKDYRALLDLPDIDYVLIATPEHWHYQMTVDAADAGKHIYCEKPMTQTIEQAKKVVAKIKQTGVKMQVGVQGMSDDSYEAAHRLIQEGALGAIVIAQIDYSRNHYESDFWTKSPHPEVKPGELDWKAWLGPAPKRPFDPDRFFAWRRYWDYSGGIASDLFIHRATRIIKSCGLTFPERVVATGGKYEFKNSPAEIPDTMNILAQYPGGPDLILVSSMANDSPVDHVIRGHKATLKFTRTGFVMTPQRGFEKDLQEIVHTKSGSESTGPHHQNLQAAIRKGEALRCDCLLGYYGVVVCDMGVQSFRKKQYLAWDKARERAVRA